MMKCDEQSLMALLMADDQAAVAPTVAGHIEQCVACQDRLAELAAQQDVWSEARHCLSSAKQSRQQTQALNPYRMGSRPSSMIEHVLLAPRHPEMLGRIGSYDVERLVGSGGMGLVFKAYDTDLNRTVAVKALSPLLSVDATSRQRFAREARAAAAVVDEHVVPIYNVELNDGSPFFVMRYIGGGSLQERLDRDGALSVTELLRIGWQVASGLQSAHAQGLIHRDVKPSNVLLDEGVDRASLTDFGLARAVDDVSLTHTGHYLGTPQYMSPEQARGEAIDSRTDLFSLGSVIYAMCTGRAPFRANTSLAVMRQITDFEPHPITDVNPATPQWLVAVIKKLHSKSPSERYQSAGEVADVLRQCLAHVQHPATESLPIECVKAEKPLCRRRLFITAALAICGLVAFSLLGLHGFEEAQAPGDSMRPSDSIRTIEANLGWEEPADEISRIRSGLNDLQSRTRPSFSSAGRTFP